MGAAASGHKRDDVVAGPAARVQGPALKDPTEAVLISIAGKPRHNKTGATLLFLAEALLGFQKNSARAISTLHPFFVCLFFTPYMG